VGTDNAGGQRQEALDPRRRSRGSGYPGQPRPCLGDRGRPDAVQFLAVAALFGLATGIPYAVAAMYEARQKLSARRSSATERIRSPMRWPNPSALPTLGPGTCPELMRSRKQNAYAPAPPGRPRARCPPQALISELNNTPCLTDYGHRRDHSRPGQPPSRLADAVRGHQHAAPGRHSRAAVAHGLGSRPFLQKYRCPAAETDGIADGRQRRVAQHRVDDSAGWASPPVDGRNLCGHRRDGSAFPAVAERRSRLHFMAQIRPSCMWRPRLAWPGLASTRDS
jgi:hypothetical protein